MNQQFSNEVIGLPRG